MSKELLSMQALASPGSNLNAYMQAVGSVAILSPEQERQLAEAYYYQEDLESARQLVLAHLRFVVHIAKSYTGYGLPLADLIQEGNVGLMKAVKRFDPERDVRLVSFAVHWIKAEIHEYILRNWRIVKVATTKAQRKLFFNLRGVKKRLAWLTNAEANAVARDLNVDIREVRNMESRLHAHDSAFDAHVDDDSDEAWQAPANYLEDANANPAYQLEQSDWEESTQKGLQRALNSLDERSRDILYRRWLADDKATLHELANHYGISAERVRQLEQNAMKKVRVTMEA